MRKFLSSFSVITCLSLILMVPAFAEHTTGGTTYGGYTGINGTMANGGNTMLDRTIGNRTGVDGVVGTGVGNGTVNNYGAYDTNRMNGTANGTRARAGANNFRAAATGDNDFDWGWLGLLGLIGLAGMRGRNRDEAR
ncbi:WGxxGxxG family protein [Cohnella sp.]|uniref:WGxxGxxG family protein n=1 Tax=Cohnella sp. TaxID=1883426 RepID=UPI0035620C0A